MLTTYADISLKFKELGESSPCSKQTVII